VKDLFRPSSITSHLEFDLSKKRSSSIFNSSPKVNFRWKNSKEKYKNQIINKPEKSIDLFGVNNDFYCHMVDSIDNRLFAFGLYYSLIIYDSKNSIFYNPITPTSLELPTIGSLHVNSLFNHIIGIGSQKGNCFLVDIEKGQVFDQFASNSQKVGSIKFHKSKPYLLACGSKDKKIKVFDLREKLKRNIFEDMSHDGEICGLSWQFLGNCLASGGNDNIVKVWDTRKTSKCLFQINEFTAAIRALEFCPYDDDLLASGGGTGDSSINITSIKSTGKNRDKIMTHSQICSLLWDKNSNRLLTSHGFAKFQMCLWNLENGELIEEYFGHSNRILDIVRIKNTKQILSFSSDNTAKIWNPFKSPKKPSKKIFTPIKLR
jgi:WD40 repeat protein